MKEQTTRPTFTPGPWHQKGPGANAMLVSDSGIIVCDPYGPNPQDECLIAAAPELYEALGEITSSLAGAVQSNYGERGIMADSYRVVIDRARAALAKADGR